MAFVVAAAEDVAEEPLQLIIPGDYRLDKQGTVLAVLLAQHPTELCGCIMIITLVYIC
jgi:hypothetical protein